MRISTAQIFNSGLATMQDRQASLLHTQKQLATGKRILTPADDPAGATEALKLRERIASVEQYARNADLASRRLNQEETVLTGMGDALQRVRELTLQAANATQTEQSRAIIATELRQIGASILDAANTRDSSGDYIFAGYRTANRPFVAAADGAVEYVGDGGRRQVALSPERGITVGETGWSLMRIPRGNGVFTVTPDPGNTGNGRVAGEVVDPSAYAGERYTLVMDTADSYELFDGDGLQIATGTYASGEPIDVGGVRIVLTGQPAAGDSFALEPAGETSLFAIVNDLAAALEAPTGSPADKALQAHRMDAALADIDQALERLVSMRTDIGARLNAIERHGINGEDHRLQLQTALSAVEDLDYADAISRFSLQQVALEAAQQTFMRMSQLSLFNFLR